VGTDARFLTSSSFSKPYVGEYLLRLRCIRHAQDLHDGPIQQPARGTEAADRLLKAFPADISNPAYNFTRAPFPGLCYSLWSSPNTLSAFWALLLPGSSWHISGAERYTLPDFAFTRLSRRHWRAGFHLVQIRILGCRLSTACLHLGLQLHRRTGLLRYYN
jgi:hypothetical protein